MLQKPGKSLALKITIPVTGTGGVLPYMGYIGMCRCEGYGFQAVYSRINQKFGSRIGYHFSGN